MQHDLALKTHLLKNSRNATYYRKTIQNEIVDCIGTKYQEEIIKDINSANCFSLIADETTDISGIEQLTICARYVNGESKLQEDVLWFFVPLVAIDAETISNKIIEVHKKLNINLSGLRGSGYDEANTITGHLSGVNVKIKEQICKQALYVHCSSHVLNLVLSHGYSISEIRNTSCTLAEFINFFNTPKHIVVLKTIVSNRVSATKRQKLISLSSATMLYFDL